MIIADAQVHIWKPNTPERPWSPCFVPAHRKEPLSQEGLLNEMDSAGVSRALLIVPPPCACSPPASSIHGRHEYWAANAAGKAARRGWLAATVLAGGIIALWCN